MIQPIRVADKPMINNRTKSNNTLLTILILQIGKVINVPMFVH
jgi:hypothetical protein